MSRASFGMPSASAETSFSIPLCSMDVNMPNKNGLEATRDIVELMPDPAQRYVLRAPTSLRCR